MNKLRIDMEMYRLMADGLGARAEDDTDRAVVRVIDSVIDLVEGVRSLTDSINEGNIENIADFLEQIVGEVKAFGEGES